MTCLKLAVLSNFEVPVVSDFKEAKPKVFASLLKFPDFKFFLMLLKSAGTE